MNKSAPTVRVSAFWKSSKGCYFLKWRPYGERSYRTQKTEITTRNRRSEFKAKKLAELKQEKLNQQLRGREVDWLWDDFCDRYHSDHLLDTSSDNQYKWNAVRKRVESVAAREVIGEFSLSDITPLFLALIETELRRGNDDLKPLAVGSIPSYMATLRSGLSWAASLELMPYMPPSRSRGRIAHENPAMRLTPITKESLEAMKKAAKHLVGQRSAESIAEYLEALWLSGCRMREPLQIHTGRRDYHYPLALSSSRPMMSWTSSQKGRYAGVHRITTDFAAHLLERTDRDGLIYKPRCETGEITDRTALSKLFSAIGKAAKVIAEDGDPPKTATAKHMRSSFVTRWSMRGMPLALIQEIVRHRSEATTKKYYVGDLRGKLDFDELPYLKT